MNRQIIVMMIILGLFIPAVASAAVPQPDRFHPNADVDIWVNARGTYNYYWNDIPAGYRISIDLEVTYGAGVDFYIMDEENYDLYVDDQSCYAEVIRESVGAISLTFTVPSSGEWHLVFYNDDWLFQRHIEGTVTILASTISSPSSLIGAVVVLAILLIGLGIGIACCKKLGAQDKKQDQGYQVPSQTSYGSPPVQEKQAVTFCPYCGNPKQLYDAKFCSRCGRSFSGPEFG